MGVEDAIMMDIAAGSKRNAARGVGDDGRWEGLEESKPRAERVPTMINDPVPVGGAALDSTLLVPLL